MILKYSKRLLFPFAVFLTLFTPVQASVVRMDIAIGNLSTDEIYIELYDELTPVTVDNFLNYINDSKGNRRYDGTFFHRSVGVSIDIIQGGGYRYANVEGATDIVTDDSIINEYDATRPNNRGTIAMARRGPQELPEDATPKEIAAEELAALNSATSQWFINVLDNSLPDYTVFGRILGNGMSTIDTIALLPTDNLGGPFTNLPTVNYTSDSLTESNLVVLTRVTASPYPPPLFVDPAPCNFGLIAWSTGPVQQTVTLRNVGNSALTLGTIDGAGTLAGTPFSVTVDNPGDCATDQVLAAFSSCTFTVLFDPLTTSNFETIFDILFNNGAQSISYDVSGTGAPTPPVLVLPELNSENAINIGDTVVGAPVTLTGDLGGLPFGNQGGADLTFSGFEITGADANDFNITGNACQTVSPGRLCIINITFDPSSTGVKSAVLKTWTNDPNMQIATLPITATANSDSDGIADAIEAAGPNNGDGNLDGVPDILQENVTSLPGISGGYITLESDAGTRLTRVSAGDNPSSGPLPTTENASLSFPNGFFFFAIEDVPVGGGVTVTLYLPEGQVAANTYFKYGYWFRTPSGYQYSRQSGFWELFDFDPRTQTGAEFQGNRVILHYVDGQRGDNDGQANGRIEDPGGPAIASADNSSSSGGGGCSLYMSPGRTGIPVDFAMLLLGLLLRWATCKHRGK